MFNLLDLSHKMLFCAGGRQSAMARFTMYYHIRVDKGIWDGKTNAFTNPFIMSEALETSTYDRRGSDLPRK